MSTKDNFITLYCWSFTLIWAGPARRWTLLRFPSYDALCNLLFSNSFGLIWYEERLSSEAAERIFDDAPPCRLLSLIDICEPCGDERLEDELLLLKRRERNEIVCCSSWSFCLNVFFSMISKIAIQSTRHINEEKNESMWANKIRRKSNNENKRIWKNRQYSEHFYSRLK